MKVNKENDIKGLVGKKKDRFTGFVPSILHMSL